MANELKHVDPGAIMTQAEYTAVTGHAFDSQATGDVPYASSASQISRLAIGSANQILSPSGGIPAWLSFVSAFTGANLAVTARDSTNNAISYIGELNAASFNTGQSCTLTIPGPFVFVVYDATADVVGLFLAANNASAVAEIADPDSAFEVADSGTAIRVYKSASGVITVKNSTLSTKSIGVLGLGKVTSATGIA